MNLPKIFPNFHLAFSRRLLERKLKKKYDQDKPIEFIMKGRNVGFFSMVFQILGSLCFCEKYGHNLNIEFSGGPYFEKSKGENWWSYYFSQNRFLFSNDNAEGKRVLNDWQQKDFSYFGRMLSSSNGHRLIDLIGIKPEILEKVSAFRNTNMLGRHVIGIHYRGTDKVSGTARESNRVPYNDILAYLKKDCRSFFFVATDEQAFLDYMRSHYDERVISHDAIRSTTSKSIHGGLLEHSMAKAGEEALIDCLLLSCCNKLFRTDSNLSLACRYFNPHQQSIIIGK